MNSRQKKILSDFCATAKKQVLKRRYFIVETGVKKTQVENRMSQRERPLRTIGL